MQDIFFQPSPTHSMGIELELQIIDLASGNLSDKAVEIIGQYNDESHVKKELTLSMIEISSSIHITPFTLYEEMRNIAMKLSETAAYKGCGICGGGRHFSNRWKDRVITPTERYQEIHRHSGYLAKLACVYGQHIHIGVKDGDDAIYLCHALIPYLPHFIALSASSPFYQSEDTFFSSSRFSALNSFQTFGYIERNIKNWSDFNKYVEANFRLGIIQTLKDIYWEVRPKPEFGTIEIRVCDTPLTIFHATMLGGYAQLLVKHLLNKREMLEPVYDVVNNTNIFLAQRYGFDADYIDGCNEEKTKLKSHMQHTFEELKDQANLDESKVLYYLQDYLQNGINDSEQLRRWVQVGMSELSIIKNMMNLLVPPEHLSYRGYKPYLEARK
ncbi:YbdK family carboxylate-amine ligase [Serratia liquefaciens]|uniref:YbdK family carboxylate-amine ligase n=1 Tax=Serratia liquefaciens TaxID=614 RepID=UPI00235FB3B7|nr:YbdK family carboxylate-amine ligase [Serratia liquefaciens]